MLIVRKGFTLGCVIDFSTAKTLRSAFYFVFRNDVSIAAENETQKGTVKKTDITIAMF